jgi:hypothetical protein
MMIVMTILSQHKNDLMQKSNDVLLENQFHYLKLNTSLLKRFLESFCPHITLFDRLVLGSTQ